MRAIPAELLAAPFTPAMAADCGVTVEQLRGQRCRRLLRGVYIGADAEVSVNTMAKAVALVLPDGCVVARTTAALLRGVDVRSPGNDAIEVLTLRERQIRRAGVRTSAGLLEHGDVTEIAGIPVTSPTRTAFDLARVRPLIERVVGLDAMLNRGGTTPDEVTAYIAAHRYWRGVRWADVAMGHAEPLSESPMETRQRMHLVLGGLPRPEAQVPLRLRNGRTARLDHGYVQWKVGVEYDGGVHGTTWREDNERQELIRELGWWHRRYTSEVVAGAWQGMVDEVRRALLNAGWRP